MKPHLVYDLGAHDGKDAKYYASLGYHVVAVEAHPDYAKCMRVISGVTIIEGAIAERARGKVKLYPSKRHGGETHSIHPHRVKDCGEVPIEVEPTSLADLFLWHGVPYYMKIDIEGSDVVAIRQLADWAKSGDVPPYLSVELDVEHPEEALEMFAHLGYMGYDTFRLVNQRLVPTGAYGDGFTWGMSGPFGPEVFKDGCGYDLTEIAGWWFSNARPFRRDWFDLHCRHKAAALELATPRLEAGNVPAQHQA